MFRKILGGIIGTAIVGGAIAGSKKSDPDTLARVGELIGQKTRAAMPEGGKIAGPLAAIRIEDQLPTEEKAQMRIRSDIRMAGSNVTVVHGGAAGEIRLRGTVVDGEQANRAIKLAETTTGVVKIYNEMAIPE